MLHTLLLFATPFSLVQDPSQELVHLELEDAIHRALQHAPALEQARMGAKAAEAGVIGAEGAFDPVFFMDATYAYTERPTAGGFFNGELDAQNIRSWNASQGLRKMLVTGGSLELSLRETYTRDNLPADIFGFNPESGVNLDFNLTQPLLRGGWTLAGTHQLRTAEITSDSSLARSAQVRVDTVQAVVDAYWSLAFALADVEVKELSLKLGEELRDVTRAKYEVGTAAEVELVQTEADIATRMEALLTARNSVTQAEDQLRLLLFPLEDSDEWKSSIRPITKPPAPEATDLLWESAYQVASLHRPNLAELRLDVHKKELDWKVAKRNLLPKLDFVASKKSAGIAKQVPDAMDIVRDFEFIGYSFGLVMEIPIGNQAAQGEELGARHQYRLSQRSLRDAENQVALEVREAVRNLNYLSARVEAATTASRVAKRQLEAEERRLQEGASTNFQVLEFQSDLETALSAEKNARMEYAKAAVKLNTVQGLAWDGGLFSG